MTTETIAHEIATRQGWTDQTLLDLSLTYIDRQQDPDAFRDYLTAVAEEEGDSTTGDDYDEATEDALDEGVTETLTGVHDPDAIAAAEVDVDEEDFGPYDWTCTYCGSALNENNFDETGSRRCYSDDHAEHLDEGDGTEFEDESHG